MTDIAETVNARMDCFQVAADGAITDYADVLIRGHLKEHPALVAYRLDVLAAMIEQVRAQATWELAERSAWGPAGDPAAEHHAAVAEFTEHTCNCDWCRHAVSDCLDREAPSF
jgi:hypothetical protein